MIASKSFTVVLAAAALVGTQAVATTVASAKQTAKVDSTVVSDELGIANVVPTWGAQIPKVVYDGDMFYAATLDGAGTQYPWSGRIWKSEDGKDWTLAQTLPGHVYQPPGLLVDGEGDLHLQVACWAGAECYPGVAPADGADMSRVYAVRLEFEQPGPDGSVDFGQFKDHSVRTDSAERYYQGMAVDPTGRYIYAAYAVNGWDMHFNVFDTVTGQDVHTTRVGVSPSGRAMIYPRVQPGKNPGEVFLTFSQYVLGTPNSAYLDAVYLWHSSDGGRTFADQRVATSQPTPDGDGNWVDASDLTVDGNGEVHTVFYRRDGGVGTLYYKRGLDGEPAAVGGLDNHSQILVRPDGEIIIFSSEGNELLVATSDDGDQWKVERHRFADHAAIYWPNLLSARSGSETPPGWHAPGRPTTGMLVGAQESGSTAFSPLLFVRYRG